MHGLKRAYPDLKLKRAASFMVLKFTYNDSCWVLPLKYISTLYYKGKPSKGAEGKIPKAEFNGRNSVWNMGILYSENDMQPFQSSPGCCLLFDVQKTYDDWWWNMKASVI